MEAAIDGESRSRLIDLLLVAALVLALRLPFLNQAVQGDDIYYLAGAEHSLIDPAHPNHARYFFQGSLVDMRGHPHPPLDAWFLGLLLAITGDVKEPVFHAWYIVFSLIAALSMYWLSRRFTAKPLYPTLLFCAVPSFVINGNSFESDIPFLAFWMLGIAAFVWRRYAAASVALALAALAAYQAIVAAPILWVWCWLHERRSRTAWAVSLTPVVVAGAFQLWERLTSGALPATVLAGYFSSYGLQVAANKLRNAAALSVHFFFLVFPPLAVRVLLRMRRGFLSAWIAIFFTAALILFFAGSARYLLPLAAPLCILAAEGLSRGWLLAGFAAQLVLSLALAFVNYQHWDGYRQFARDLQPMVGERRVWVNGEWGLRYYLESEGAMPVERGRALRPGDIVVTSQLGYPVPVTTGGAQPVPLLERAITSSLPLRLIGVGSRSGYSTASLGFLPFDIMTGPIDRVRADVLVKRQPTLSYLPMNSPEAPQHIVSGAYELEDNRFRWMGKRAVFLLKPPPQPEPLSVKFFIPDTAPGRTVTVSVDDKQVARRTYDKPGAYTLETSRANGSLVVVEIDEGFSVPGDNRQLGMILTEVGYR
jgi:hypothetical protein